MITPKRDHTKLLRALWQEYEERHPKSKGAHTRAQQVLVDGISHGARLFKPYPFRVTAAHGATVTDIDGNEIIDFWQGHYANILGHNPAVIRETLVHELEEGYGLQTGLPEDRQTEFAETLANAVGADRVRLTTAGTLATMYAIMLARAYTGRRLVIKIAGGWHGANPLALKGVGRTETGFDSVDSSGVPPTTGDEIILTQFNDTETLKKIFRTMGDRIACFICEPVVGNGFMLAVPEFLRTARELTEQYGAMLILDEVITGFRYCAGGVQRLYGVVPDLATFGKIIGGGMPLSAVVGRQQVMDLAGQNMEKRVWFNGGTFSAHPLALLAGTTMIRHLIAHQDEIYSALANKGERLRTGVEKVFADRGILARCTGHSNTAVPGSSLQSIYFPLREDHYPTSVEALCNPILCDRTLSEEILKLGLLLHDVNIVHGLGAISLAHTDEHMARVLDACDAFAKRISQGA